MTAIQFQDPNTLISSSDLDGIIKVWDMRKSYDRYSRQPQPKYQFTYPGKSALKGYSALVLDPAKTQLFASCKDHTIYKFDVAAYSEKPIAMYTGFENNSKYFSRLSLSPGLKFTYTLSIYLGVQVSLDKCKRCGPKNRLAYRSYRKLEEKFQKKAVSLLHIREIADKNIP